MNFYILTVSVIILMCLALAKFSRKLGMPILLAFILLGMFFGTDGLFKIDFDNYDFAEKICSAALIFIMFYGGFGTNWSSAKPIVAKAVTLSSLGVILTSAITGLFCYYVLKFSLFESMLIGSVISSTDAASVFSILRSKKISFKHNTAQLLEMESGSNDPFSYMLTIIVLSAAESKMSGGSIVYMIFAQIVFGVLIGVLCAYVSKTILPKIAYDGIDTAFIFSMALISYSAASMIGGNGYLSTYIFGIILGNCPIKNKKSLVHFFDGVTLLMQMLIFFLLGLLSFPSKLPTVMGPAILIALFLTFVARPLSVFAILAPQKCPFKQQLLVSWCGIRGAASIVFAIMANVHPAYLKNDVFHIVFFIVLFSISIQGSLLPYVSKKLGMIDENGDIMKTFSDYTEEMPIQFIKIYVGKNHPWINKKVCEIKLLPEVLLVTIMRGGEKVIPKGNTVIYENDILILSALSFESSAENFLTELTVDENHEWAGKRICELKFADDALIVVIKRKDSIIIPNGRTLVKPNDVLVISR